MKSIDKKIKYSRFFLLFFLAILIIFLAGCSKKQESNQKTITKTLRLECKDNSDEGKESCCIDLCKNECSKDSLKPVKQIANGNACACWCV